MSFQSYVAFVCRFAGILFNSLRTPQQQQHKRMNAKERHLYLCVYMSMCVCLQKLFFIPCHYILSNEQNSRSSFVYFVSVPESVPNECESHLNAIEQPLQSFRTTKYEEACCLSFYCIVWFVCALDIFCWVLSQTL